MLYLLIRLWSVVQVKPRTPLFFSVLSDNAIATGDGVSEECKSRGMESEEHEENGQDHQSNWGETVKPFR
jgi:hypothetical protein